MEQQKTTRRLPTEAEVTGYMKSLSNWDHGEDQLQKDGSRYWVGTQGAPGEMYPGDTIEVEISGIGLLRNYLVAED